MKIGFSFFWQSISGMTHPNKPQTWKIAISDFDTASDNLKNLGVSSIEIKLTEHVDMSALSAAIKKLIDKGFQITFHAPGRVHYPEDLSSFLETMITITKLANKRFKFSPLWVLHSLHGQDENRDSVYQNNIEFLKQTVKAMKNVSAHVALEILRNRSDSNRLHIGDSYSEILKIIDEVGDDDLGICWDFGHAFAMFERDVQDKFPPEEFLKKVVHCHVHDCSAQKTHLPLGFGRVPIEENIQLLKENNFSGVLNLEIVPHKIKDPENFMQYVENNIKMIQNWVN